jgi:hypothetical protein
MMGDLQAARLHYGQNHPDKNGLGLERYMNNTPARALSTNKPTSAPAVRAHNKSAQKTPEEERVQ